MIGPVNGDSNYCSVDVNTKTARCAAVVAGDAGARGGRAQGCGRGRQRRRQCLTRLGPRLQRPQESNRVVVFGSRSRVV